MNVICLMEALTDVDAVLVEKAYVQKKIKKHPVGRILLIAAVIVAMAVSVFAVSETVSWFTGYFKKNTGGLAQEQIKYIEGNTVQQHHVQTCNGYSIVVESTFSDGNVGYVKMILIAPEDVVMDAQSYYFTSICFDPAEGGGNSKVSGFSTDTSPREAKNEMDVVFTVEGNLEHTALWKLQFQNIYANYYEELENGEVQIRDELVAKGIWRFDIAFSNTGNQVREFVSAEPVIVTVNIGLDREWFVDVVVTSVKLWTMSAEVRYSHLMDTDGAADLDFCVVMLDGTQVRMGYAEDARPGICSYRFSEPLMLSEVAYILMSNGVRLYPK